MPRPFFYTVTFFSLMAINTIAATNNQAMMYKMLNDSPGYEDDPTAIRHQRYWQRMKKLQWLANPRNLLKPGLDENYEDFTS